MNYPLYLQNLIEGKKGMNPYLDYFDISVVEIGDGRAVFEMPIRSEYFQGAKVMQGGLITAMADETIAHAMMTLLLPDEGLATIELKSNFLASVSSGYLISRASVFKKGKSLILGDCIVSDEKNKLVCRVSATFMLLTKKK